MTTGIYGMVFTSINKAYIGQSVDIDHRWCKHQYNFKNGISSKKLQEAYNVYGLPEFHVLKVCTTEDLDKEEIILIKEFDSIKNGLNTCGGGSSYSGTEAPTSVYLEDQIITVAKLLAFSPDISYIRISEISGVSVAVIKGIQAGRDHIWIQSRLPEIYAKIQEVRPTRETLTKIESSNKLCAASMGYVYPIIMDKDGKEYTITNARQFAIANNIHPANLGAVLNGRRLSTGGFRLLNPSDRPEKWDKEYPTIVSPNGIEYIITNSIASFSRLHSLDETSLSALLNGTINSHKKWQLKSKIENLGLNKE